MCVWLVVLFGVADACLRPLPGNPRIGEARNPGPSVNDLFDASDIDPFEDLHEELEAMTFPGAQGGGGLHAAARLPESEGAWGAGPPHLEDSSDDDARSEVLDAERDAGDSSDEDEFVCTAAWRTADRGAGITSRGATTEQAQTGRAWAARRALGAATQRVSFAGARAGQVFTTRGAVTGYFPDGMAGGGAAHALP